MEKFVSDLSGKEFPVSEKVMAKLIRKPVIDLIKKEHATINEDSVISLKELSYYREKYISDFLDVEMSQLADMEAKVIDALKEKTIIANDPDKDEQVVSTYGQRVADKVATFGGSWTFIILFITILIIWIATNVFLLSNKGFDPYPFILLNLILSCVAALQAPVIMMSQNRQEEKDRQRAKNDYMVNLKAEMEIRLLHEKLDHLILHQEQSLIEIQKVQIDMMNDILSRMGHK